MNAHAECRSPWLQPLLALSSSSSSPSSAKSLMMLCCRGNGWRVGGGSTGKVGGSQPLSGVGGKRARHPHFFFLF